MDALIASAAVTGSAAGMLGWAVRGRASRVFGESVYRGDRGRRTLALTFDDGPSESTPLLLDLLARLDLRATFFLCGNNVRRCPEIACQIQTGGHEIGNHTESHPRLDFKTAEFIHREMATAQQTILDVTGARPVWFRAPYGVRWFGVDAAQRALGLRGAMWTTIARDWTLPAQAIAARLDGGMKNGAILCLHDGRALRVNPDIRETLQALEVFLPRLKDAGYRCETLTELTACQKK